MIDSLFLSSTQATQARNTRTDLRPAAAVKAVSLQGTGEGERSDTQQQAAQALQHAVEHIQSTQRTLQFSVEEASGNVVVKVIDSETQEMIRQIPSEEVLGIATRLEAATKGVLIDEQA